MRLSPGRIRPGLAPLLMVIFLLVAPAVDGHALAALQTDQEAAQPRIGLVLGGGGARGFAHVGVLKVLEELRIPISYIAGTSMGSIIGGIYAQGYTAEQLEEIVLGEPWDRIFDPGPDRAALPLRRKREQHELGIDFEVGISSSGLELPSGLVTDERLNNALAAYTARARGIDDFDRLPIPYRAVATDVESGEMVVLNRGPLDTALRASMAVPGAFPPVERDGRRLVDGGLVRNIPVDVVLGMGADVVIAVDVSTTLDDAASGDDAVSLLARMTTIYSTRAAAGALEDLREGDLLIQPDLVGHSGADFGEAGVVMAIGEEAARTRISELRRFSSSDEDWTIWRRAVSSAIPEPGPIVIGAVVVDTTNTRLSPRTIRTRTRVAVGDTLTLPALRTEMDALVGRGSLGNAAFSLRPGVGETDTLVVRPRDPAIGSLVLRTGLSLYDRGRGFGRWNLRTRVGTERLTRRGGEGWMEVEIGTRRSIGAWGYIPVLDSDRFFLIGEGRVGTEALVPSRASFVPIEYELRRRRASGGIGLRLGSWGETAVQGILERVELSIDGGVGGARASAAGTDRALVWWVEGDVLDRAAFPSSGHRIRASYRYGDFDEDDVGKLPYDLLHIEGQAALSRGHHTLRLRGLWAAMPRLDDAAETPVHLARELGGPDGLTASAHQEVWGGFAALASAEWSYRLGVPAAQPGSAGFHLGIAFEAGEAALTRELWETRRDSPLVGASLRLGKDTPLGPVVLAWGVLRDARPTWSVRIGPEFPAAFLR